MHRYLNHNSVRAASYITEAGARRLRTKASVDMPCKHMVEDATQKNHSWEQARDECIATMTKQQEHQCPLWNKEATDTARLLVQRVRAVQDTIQGRHIHHKAAQTATNTDAILIAAARLAARATHHCWVQIRTASTVASTQAEVHPEERHSEQPLAVLTATTQESNHQQQPQAQKHPTAHIKEKTETMYYDCQEPTLQT